jgi:hypothetical protein
VNMGGRRGPHSRIDGLGLPLPLQHACLLAVVSSRVSSCLGWMKLALLDLGRAGTRGAPHVVTLREVARQALLDLGMTSTRGLAHVVILREVALQPAFLDLGRAST